MQNYLSLKKCKISIIVIFLVSLILLVGCNKADDNLTNNPSIEKVRDAISEIKDIGLIEIVTEDNDPNGNLGKQGGYTGCLFFLSPLVTDVTEESALSAGTEGGGCIEVYANKEDAEKRNEYLSSFDGTAFSSGSHKVIGTLVIRTSDKLKASQQSELETAIITALQSK